MFGYRVFFLIAVGRISGEKMADALLQNAYIMYKGHEHKRHIKTDTCEGEMWTSFESVALKSITGIRFSARLESDLGNIRYEFILRDRDIEELESLEEGAWDGYDQDGNPVRGEPRPSAIRHITRSPRNN